MEESKAQLKAIRVQYNTFKFKFVIADPAQTFEQLSVKLVSRLQEMGQSVPNTNKYTLTDEDDFAFANTDVISDLLTQNDLIKVTSEPLPQSVVITPPTPLNDQEAAAVSKVEEQQLPVVEPAKPNVEEEVAKTNNPVVEVQPQEELKVDLVLADEEPKEAIVVLFDVSGSMKSQFFTDHLLSRMGAVNALFSAFADKTMAYELKHLVQLYTFDDRIEKKCEFTEDMNYFIHLVDGAQPRGSTRLYDALVEGVNSLIQIKAKYPNILLRIIALTDGEDNRSTYKPVDVAKLILKNRITLDSFVVSHQSQGLKSITHVSGGRCYCPEELITGMKLFEIETILSVRARDVPLIDDSKIDTVAVDLEKIKNQPFDTEGIKVNVQTHLKNEAGSVEEILKKYRDLQAYQPPANSSSSQQQQPQATEGKSSQQQLQKAGTGAMKRIMKEMNDYSASGHPNFKIFPESDDITKWKVLLIGPEGSCYSQGVYMLYVTLPADYPFKPPQVRFLTPVYHCNVSSQGRICLDILKDQWSPALTVMKVMASIVALLGDPNPDDALESSIAAEMKHEKDLFKQKSLHHVLTYANSSIDELLKDIFGATIDKKSEGYLKNEAEIKSWIDYHKSKNVPHSI